MRERVKRKADVVTDDLLRRIVGGSIPVGSILPKESELATEYGVNRSVIRESVKRLEVHRLLEPVRRRGTLVLEPEASLSPEVLRAMLRPDGVHIDVRTLTDVLELREHLDGVMTRLAAERSTPEDVANLRDCFTRLEQSLHDPVAFHTERNHFAIAMARASKNLLFEMLAHWNFRVYQELEALFLQVRLATPAYLQGLDAVLNAIEAHDVELAARLVQAFHAWARPRILELAAEFSAPATNTES